MGSKDPNGRAQTMCVINPLGGALHHYTEELTTTLRSAGHEVQVETILEPSQSKGGSITWLLRYMTALLRARQLQCQYLITWPCVGYLDFVLARLLAGNGGSLVVHDPMPLVRARGYGRVSQWIAARALNGVGLIVHSSAAEAALPTDSLRRHSVRLPHPMMRLRPKSPATAQPVIRVLGQYKTDRDLDALHAIGRTASEDYRLEIIGRGWPSIPGWSVRNEFIQESEMDNLIRTASVVLIPYTRFYQSGVAIRCLEQLTPFVGPAATSLEEIVGENSRLLVSETNSWLQAIDYAMTSVGQLDVKAAATGWYERALSAWKYWRPAAVSAGGRQG